MGDPTWLGGDLGGIALDGEERGGDGDGGGGRTVNVTEARVGARLWRTLVANGTLYVRFHVTRAGASPDPASGAYAGPAQTYALTAPLVRWMPKLAAAARADALRATSRWSTAAASRMGCGGFHPSPTSQYQYVSPLRGHAQGHAFHASQRT